MLKVMMNKLNDNLINNYCTVKHTHNVTNALTDFTPQSDNAV